VEGQRYPSPTGSALYDGSAPEPLSKEAAHPWESGMLKQAQLPHEARPLADEETGNRRGHSSYDSSCGAFWPGFCNLLIDREDSGIHRTFLPWQQLTRIISFESSAGSALS
jgi:hypothetical protein